LIAVASRTVVRAVALSEEKTDQEGLESSLLLMAPKQCA